MLCDRARGGLLGFPITGTFAVLCRDPGGIVHSSLYCDSGVPLQVLMTHTNCCQLDNPGLGSQMRVRIAMTESSVLLDSHQGQGPDEDVREVEEDVDGDVDGVVQRLGEALCHVHVVDHDGCEQNDADDVEESDAQAQPGSDQGQPDETEQTSEEGSTPHRQILGHDCADESREDDDACRESEGLEDAAELVERDERSHHEPHCTGADEAADDRGHGVVMSVGQEGAADGDRHASQDEAEEQPCVVELPLVAEGRAECSHHDVEGREDADGEHERLTAHRVDLAGARS